MDCPVSGGTARAADGTLTILAAGADTAVQRAQQLLRDMSAKLYVISEHLGAASNMKMVNQLLVGCHIVASAEAMGLAAKLDLNTREVFEIIQQCSGDSWAFGNRVPHMLDNDWTPLSALSIFVKDMVLRHLFDRSELMQLTRSGHCRISSKAGRISRPNGIYC